MHLAPAGVVTEVAQHAAPKSATFSCRISEVWCNMIFCGLMSLWIMHEVQGQHELPSHAGQAGLSEALATQIASVAILENQPQKLFRLTIHFGLRRQMFEPTFRSSAALLSFSTMRFFVGDRCSKLFLKCLTWPFAGHGIEISSGSCCSSKLILYCVMVGLSNGYVRGMNASGKITMCMHEMLM